MRPRISRRESGTAEILRSHGLGVRGLGFRVLGFRVLGFRVAPQSLHAPKPSTVPTDQGPLTRKSSAKKPCSPKSASLHPKPRSNVRPRSMFSYLLDPGTIAKVGPLSDLEFLHPFTLHPKMPQAP